MGIWFSIVIIIIGILLIIGTRYRWRLLVDPPEEWSPYYSYSWINKHFGSQTLIVLNYFGGVALIILGSIFLWHSISGIIN